MFLFSLLFVPQALLAVDFPVYRACGFSFNNFFALCRIVISASLKQPTCVNVIHCFHIKSLQMKINACIHVNIATDGNTDTHIQQTMIVFALTDNYIFVYERDFLCKALTAHTHDSKKKKSHFLGALRYFYFYFVHQAAGLIVLTQTLESLNYVWKCMKAWIAAFSLLFPSLSPL